MCPFTDCGRRNVSTLIPEDSDTPDQSSDSAPSAALANRTSPGYTDRQTGDVIGYFGENKQEEACCDIISGAGGRLPGR